MARITVEDCLDNVENRFDLGMIASKRARQLQTGGKDAMVNEDNDKPTVVALREIAEGHIDSSILIDKREEETQKSLEAVDAAAAEAAAAAAKSTDISIEEAMDAVLIPEADESEVVPPAGADESEQ